MRTLTVFRRIRNSIIFLFLPLKAITLREKAGDHITLYGFYGASDKSPDRNIGDNAILSSMLAVLDDFPFKKLIGVIEPNGAYSRYGEEFCAKIRVNDLREWLRIISRTHLFILGGGGLFQDYGTCKWVPLVLMQLSLLFWLSGRKIMWYSVGIGPLLTKQGKFFTRIAAMMATIVTVRDNESKELLVNIGVKPSCIYVTADPVVSLSPKAADVSSTFKKYVGFSLMPFHAIVYGDENRDIIWRDILIEFMRFLLSEGWSIKLFAFHNGPDTPFCMEIITQLDSENVVLVEPSSSVEQVLNEYNSLSYFVGMRFHSIVFSCLFSIPVISIIYHPKVRSLVENAKLPDYAIDVGQLDLSILKSMWYRLKTDAVGIKERMGLWIDKQNFALATNIKLMTSLLYDDDNE